MGTAVAAAAAALACSSRVSAAARPWVEYDLRVNGTGAKIVDVTHTGQTVIIDMYATVHGLNLNPDDAIGSSIGTFTTSTGGLLGDLLGLGPPAPFNASGSTGTPTDADADGDLDIWSASTTSATGKYAFRRPPPYPIPQPAGGSLVAQVQFTVSAFSLDQTELKWKNMSGLSGMVATSDGGPINGTTADYVYNAPVTIRGVELAPPPGVVYLSGNVAAHTSIAQETWVAPGQSLTFDTGIDVASTGALNSAGRPLQINVNDATSGNAGGTILGGNIAVATTADGTFTQTAGSTQVGNIVAGAAATRTGTVNLTGGTLQASTLSLGGGGGTGVYTQSGGTANLVQLAITNNSAATVSGGQLVAVGVSTIGGSGGGTGTFTQAGGATSLNGEVRVGVGAGASGRLVVSDGTLLAGLTRLGADGGTGTLEISGNGVFKPSILIVNHITGAGASAAMSGGQLEATSIQFLGAGVFSQSGGAVTTSPLGTLVVDTRAGGDTQYVISGGSLTAGAIRIGKTNAAPLPGSGKAGGFVQSGGVVNVKSLTVLAAGTLDAAGGAMNVGASLDLGGTLDYGGSSAQLNVGTNAFASFVRGNLLAANNATFSGANGSLMSFKDQAQYNSVGTVNSSGLIHIAGQPLVIEENQSIGGSGTIEGNVTNEGTIAPGASPGALGINGSYTQASTGALLMEIAGIAVEEFDTLTSVGPATLDGTLNVALLDDFVPSATDSFRIISASSLSGAFDNVIGGAVSFAGGRFDVAYAPNGVTLSNCTAVPEPGGVAMIAFGAVAATIRRRGRSRTV